MIKKTAGVIVIACLLVFAISYVIVLTQASNEIIDEVVVPLKESLSESWEVSFVSGTEYFPNQEGQVIVEARLSNGTSVIYDTGGNITNCVANIWYPDKSSYIATGPMILHSNSENAFIEFIVPAEAGVYEYQAICSVDGESKRISKSFHVTKKRIRAEVIK